MQTVLTETQNFKVESFETIQKSMKISPQNIAAVMFVTKPKVMHAHEAFILNIAHR